MTWRNRTHIGDVRAVLGRMIADGVKVQTIITSPPYWALRDYGVKGQIGLERDPVRYLARMRSVFRLLWQVLEDDGTCWVNIGDSYYTPRVNGGIGYNSTINGQGSQAAYRDAQRTTRNGKNQTMSGPNRRRSSRLERMGIKEKDLIGIPWMLAFTLRADGWYLRSDIIWHKPNPMPESVRDRPTKSHEYLFMLAKSERYFYDAKAIKENVSGNAHRRKPVAGWKSGEGSHSPIDHAQGYASDRKFKVKNNDSFNAALGDLVDTRNKRTVWTVPTEAFSGEHYAAFPRALIEPCVLAGSKPGQAVLDPFMGTGTTAQVATDLGRDFIGIDLDPRALEHHENHRRTTIGLPL